MAMGEKGSDEANGTKVDINLRAPKVNIDEARKRANARGMSLNAWICDAIADKLEDIGRILPFGKIPPKNTP